MIGDFLGFTFGDKHSSELGIVRTSNGSRYSLDLLPTATDKIVQVPGADRTYYFGSTYNQKVFSIPVAFDNLTEEQIMELRFIFGMKKITRLIFDETPYKQYMVKSNGLQNLNYVSFDIKDSTGTEQRIYKGEGTLQFIAYEPFATNRIENGKSLKFLDDYKDYADNGGFAGLTYHKSSSNSAIIHNHSLKAVEEEVEEVEVEDATTADSAGYFQWAVASRMKTKEDYSDYSIPQEFSSDNILLYNAGDRETDFKIYIYGEVSGVSNFLSYFKYTLNTIDGNYSIELDGLENINHTSDNYYGIIIDTKTNLVQLFTYGHDTSGEPTAITILPIILNKYIIAGTFKKLPPSNESNNYLSLSYTPNSEVLDSNDTITHLWNIEYNYIYY